MLLQDIGVSFAEDMADPEYVAGYLEAVLEEGDPATFLIALHNVAVAQSENPKGIDNP
jgi:DNA-binding phage protein